MITRIKIKNFKMFEDVDIEVGSPVVFVGPNNSGKTSALQALTLWEIGVKRWHEKKGEDKGKPEKRPGVTINRRDLLAIPVPNAKLLWRSLQVRKSIAVDQKPKTQNVLIEITVEGSSQGKDWQCGLEFDYANEESFYCRPLHQTVDDKTGWMAIPAEAVEVHIALLPPMSGLAANEERQDNGAIDVRVGEGRTAEVLRNLCYRIYTKTPGKWQELTGQIGTLFGVKIEEPIYKQERGEIVMSYQEKGKSLDISCSGRGLQQTLLLLSYMYANPGSILLLDEPDAHLEILRQRHMYQFLADEARKNRNQIIMASHSEVLLNEAAERDTVIAFLGKKPHRIDDRGSQLLKSLRDIGFEDYFQAEQTGWVLYLEGSTDLLILQAFAGILDFWEAIDALNRPFVHYLSANQVIKAVDHFHGLKEAVSNLKGIGIFDRLDKGLPSASHPDITLLSWQKREIENYFCLPETLEAFAMIEDMYTLGPLFRDTEGNRRKEIMKACIEEITTAMESLGKGSPWSGDTKVSDEFLTPLFKKYFEKLKLRNPMQKNNFHRLARYIPKEKIDPEIKEKLNEIVKVAGLSNSGQG